MSSKILDRLVLINRIGICAMQIPCTTQLFFYTRPRVFVYLVLLGSYNAIILAAKFSFSICKLF